MLECPLCKNSIDQKKYLKNYMFNFYAENYKQKYYLYHCSNCHIEFWWPLKFVAEFYEKYLPQHEIDTMGFRSLPLYSKMFFELLPLKSGRLLDIGCGDGVFLEYAQKKGFEVAGIDLDEKCGRAAQEKRGLENLSLMCLNDFAEFGKSNNLQYDVISFFEVLEHQDDPKRFLDDVKVLLRKGGYIAGSVPNRERLFSKLDWKSFMGDFPPPHLTRWSQGVLRWFIEKEGFINVEFCPIGFANTREAVNWFETVLLLRKLSHGLKKVFSQKDSNCNNTSSARDFRGMNSGRSKKLINMLKVLTDAVLVPLALATQGAFDRRGSHIYFQAKL